MSDIKSIVHIGVPSSITKPWQSATGGVGRDEESARLAAIGEAIERYCAAIAEPELKTKKSIPRQQRIDAEEWCLFTRSQRDDQSFPFGQIYSNQCLYTNAFDLQDNKEVWIPHPFVVLRDDYQTGIPTSSGLAAGSSFDNALLRAIQELIERDALMMTWLHSVPARAVKPAQKYMNEVGNVNGQMWVFDLTPIYSPFPVIAVAGGIPKRGKLRYSLGVACRETWDDALEKAYLEWNQGILFAGIYSAYVDTSQITNPYKLKSFDEHAVYYTLYPEQWPDLSMFQKIDKLYQPSIYGQYSSTKESLKRVREALRKSGIRMYHRDLTTVDADQLGVRVVRATSPDLASIFGHQEWPLIGNLENKLQSRYPWASHKLVFPNKMPHPLG